MDFLHNLKLPELVAAGVPPAVEPGILPGSPALVAAGVSPAVEPGILPGGPAHSALLHHRKPILRRAARRWPTLALLLLILFTPFARAAGSETSMPEYQVKALFLFNFGKYVEWPDTTFPSQNSPLIIGILGNSNFDDFSRVLKDKTIGGRKIFVRQITNDQEVLDCQLLFINSSERARLSDILQLTRARPILTVSDIEKFAQSGGIIGFIKKENRIRLEIDLEAAQRAQLQLSSKLLNVADTVRGKQLAR